jgi:tol-pal system protein YbgF
MRLTGVLCGGVLVAGLCVPAPLMAQNRVELQMTLDLRDLHEENRQLLAALNALADQLKTVSAKIDAEATARSKGFADQQTLVNNANSAVSALQEKVSENKVQVQKLTQELDAVKKGVDMLTVMVTQALAQMPTSPPPVDPNAPPGTAPSAPVPAAGGVPASSKEYYDRAFGDYTVGQWDMAVQGFQEYLKRFPEAPDAPQAQRYIGEAYFMQGKYPDAVAAYDQVIKKYKTADSSDAVPDAYYKQGVSFEQLKQRDQAIANYQLLRKEYPNSNAALQATQDLKRLGILK